MSEQDIAAKAVAALGRAADQAVGNATDLVSIAIEMLRSAPVGEIQPRVTRKTRTLVFMAADILAADGERIAVASSVHKLSA